MNEPIKFFEKQKKLYPKKVHGKYRKIKWIIMILTMSLYYFLPWLRWNRGKNVPDQAILIDLPNRRAYFFDIEIWPQEIYYLTGFLIIAAVLLFFVTSLFGRVWCGYACPQTIWTDLFVWVERIIQGDRNARIKLDKSSWTSQKIWKKFLTHFIWLIVGFLTGGAWVLYFNDAPTIISELFTFSASPMVVGWVLSLTLSTYVMAGFARDQVCSLMCPYARFQSGMFDKDTLIVGYDTDRGEKRGKHKKGDSFENRGHCINCFQCVNVCPQGIDIRDGLQMECIACGLCIDACNSIMDKINLPHGLVRYDTENNVEARKNGKEDKIKFIRARTIFYTIILSVASYIMIYNMLNREMIGLNVLHDRNPLFVTLSDGYVRNGYNLKLINKSHNDVKYFIKLKGIAVAILKNRVGEEINYVNVRADSVKDYKVFVSAPIQNSKRKDLIFEISLIDKYGVEIKQKVTNFFISK